MKKLHVYILLILISIVMLYPMLWLLGASFKTNAEIFNSIWFLPKHIDFEAYINGWKTVTPYTMGHYFFNTFKIILPKVFLAVISSVLVAYGFARFDFPFKRIFYAFVLCSMFMPQIVTLPPMLTFWRNVFGINFLDTYIPLIIPSMFACEGMFIFILVQFFKNIPKEFDEAAKIDGCGTIKTLIFVLAPCIRPAIVSIAVFTFLWTMNDFLSPLIFIQSVDKYPLTLALRLSVDSTGQGYEQNKIIAMSIIGLIPSIAMFALAQKKFVNGITAGGLSG